MKSLGDCYEAAGRAFMNHCFGSVELLDWIELGPVMLVHGRPTLTVEPFIEYGHAWIEIGDVLVYDAEREIVLPLAMFYQVGQIDQTKCLRYDFESVRRWTISTEHWGPWEGPDGAPFKIWEEKRRRRTR